MIGPLSGSSNESFDSRRTSAVAWATEARTPVVLRVNGRPEPVRVQAGFTTVAREWRTGDTVELELPMELRLVEIPGSVTVTHPETVALMRGPMVLFPLGAGPHAVHAVDALGAKQTGARAWTVKTRAGDVRMAPFTEIGEETYSTYLRLSSGAS